MVVDKLKGIFNKDQRIVIGMVSGTSGDSVHAVVIRVVGCGEDTKFQELGFAVLSYPDEVRKSLFECFRPETSRIDLVCHLNFVIGEVYAQAALVAIHEAGISPSEVDLIGMQGQTTYYMPKPVTTGGITTSSVLLLGEPAVVAERIGVTTVSHFRNRDMAAGGLGAPLTGFGDYVLYHHPELNRAVQNIGGIANVCLVPANGGIDVVIGFDTGPGNMVIDALVNMMTAGEQQFDRDGTIAAQGKVNEELLAESLADSYFSTPPPKTTGRERFGVQFATALWEKGHKQGLSDADIVAVATVLTANSIANAYKQFLFPLTRLDQIIVGGGGAYNKTMMQQLQLQMAPVPVLRAEDLGISSYSREAVYAALLANETVSGRAANLPMVTGARRSVVMGAISLPS